MFEYVLYFFRCIVFIVLFEVFIGEVFKVFGCIFFLCDF